MWRSLKPPDAKTGWFTIGMHVLIVRPGGQLVDGYEVVYRRRQRRDAWDQVQTPQEAAKAVEALIRSAI
jgi:hypothetical protein